MEKKYFYVDNLHEYGKRLYRKRLPEDWIFANLSEDVFCLYNEKTRKIVMSKKHPKDKPDIYIAFAICYHKYMGWAEPKEKVHLIEKAAAHLKIGEIFYLPEFPQQEQRCCGFLKNGIVLYESTADTAERIHIYRLRPTFLVCIKKEN